MTTQSMQIAETILAQLGGNRFVAMTGAKGFCATGDGLSFKLPSATRADGKRVNHVRVTLNGSDLYDVSFYYLTTKALAVVSDSRDVYAEDLQETFTAGTGLYTRL